MAMPQRKDGEKLASYYGQMSFGHYPNSVSNAAIPSGTRQTAMTMWDHVDEMNARASGLEARAASSNTP